MKRKHAFASIKILLSLAFLACLTGLYAQEEQISDEKISNRIEAELVFQSNVPADQIDVSTDENIVTLTGSVDHILAKSRTEKVATAVKGVEGVVNLIDVNPPFRSDYTIKADVEKALLEDPATDSYEIEVAVNDGKVILSGQVDSWQEKQLSGYVSKSVKGVRALSNEINIDFDTDRPDFDVKEEIKKAIASDIRLNSELITVTVNDGMVKLDGVVGTLNAKQQAESYAWTAGVREVNAESLKVNDWAKANNFRKTEYPVRSDEEVKESVKNAFLYDPRVFSFQPDVTVNNGVVTLSGKVDNLKAKRAAEADARNVVGVFNVKNNIKVRPDMIPENPQLEDDVEDALFRDPYVERFDLSVSANNGVVYLNGTVDNYYEKFRAEDVAARTYGVLNVVNNIDVSATANYNYYYPYGWNSYYPTPYTTPENYYTYSLSDEQIENNIEDELWWSPFVTEDQVTVEVANSVATLTGTVDSWREKEMAAENAYEGGAYSVLNKLKVKNNGPNQ